MSRIVLTGAGGFIGSHVLDLLVERGHEVTVLDNLDAQVHGPAATWPEYVKRHAPDVRLLRGDVRSSIDVSAALFESGAEAVVHLAATVGVGQSMYLPSYYTDTNCHGTGVLLKHIAEARDRVRRIVVASSMSLYGEGARIDRSIERPFKGELPTEGEVTRPTPETHPPQLASIYAATKKFQEDACIAFGRAYEIPTFALRFFNTYGPRQSLRNPYTGVVAIFLSRLLEGERPIIFGDGRQSRDFIDVRDVASAVVAAVESDAIGCHALNIGTGVPTSIRSVAEVLASVLGVDISPEIDGRQRAGDVRHCYGDTLEAKRVLGFQAGHRFHDMDSLGPLIDWARRQPRRGGAATQATAIAELERAGLVR